MQVISYISKCTIPDAQKPFEMERLVRSARTRNAALGVTGVLFHENNCFFQTIEGPYDSLRDVFARIQHDPRHDSIIKLVDEPIKERAFSGWAMDSFELDNPELFNPGLLQKLKALYTENFRLDGAGLVAFVKYMVDELDTYKISRNLT